MHKNAEASPLPDTLSAKHFTNWELMARKIWEMEGIIKARLLNLMLQLPILPMQQQQQTPFNILEEKGKNFLDCSNNIFSENF